MTKATPTITVVIATHNRAHLISRAIQSVLYQTLSDFELLVVDDGSRDDTHAVVHSISDPRIRYIRHAENKGLPASRNTGIRAARGRYVAFLDDDDEWNPVKLAKQRDAMNRFDAVLCAALVDNQRVKRHARSCVMLRDLRRGNDFDPSSLMVKADLLKALWFDETLRVGEDWDMFIRIAKRGPIGYLDEPLLIYHQAHVGRMTAESATLTLDDVEKRMSMLYKHRAFFGEYWFNFHVARYLLSYWRGRADKIPRLTYSVRRCGLLPVVGALADKLRRALGSQTNGWVRLPESSNGQS